MQGSRSYAVLRPRSDKERTRSPVRPGFPSSYICELLQIPRFAELKFKAQELLCISQVEV